MTTGPFVLLLLAGAGMICSIAGFVVVTSAVLRLLRRDFTAALDPIGLAAGRALARLESAGAAFAGVGTLQLRAERALAVLRACAGRLRGLLPEGYSSSSSGGSQRHPAGG